MTVEPAAAVVESKKARVGGARWMVSGEDGPHETEQPSGVETGSGEMPPQGVDEPVTRGGEAVVGWDHDEPGRFDDGTDGTPAERPTGGSVRDATGVNPQEPIMGKAPRRPLNFDPGSSPFPPWHR